MRACPICGHSNIEGIDQCEACEGDLQLLDSPESQATGLSKILMHDSILKLQPKEAVEVYPEQSVADVVQTMIDRRCGAVLVMFQGRLVGIFTERDFLLKIADRYDVLAHEPIRKFMTADPRTVETKDSVAFGLHVMAVGKLRHLPVTQEGRTVGIVGVPDVLQYIARHMAEVRA